MKMTCFFRAMRIKQLAYCVGVAALSAASQSALAANWYVDNAVATSGNGQSWVSSFKTFSAIPWPSVRAGDTIYVSGGPAGGSKIYTEAWSISATGAAGNPVIITIDAANVNHNGTATFDYDARGDRATGTGITISNRGYVTITGNVGGQNRIAIKNLRNVVDRTNATCLGGFGNNSIIIDHVDFVNCNNGVRLWSGSMGSGSVVRNSNFRQIRGDVAIMLDMGGTTWDAHKIHDNSIELLNNTAVPSGGSGAYVGPDGIQTGDGVSIFNNTVRVNQTSLYTSNQHTDDIQFGMARYLKIYNNEFVNVGDSVIDLGTWGSNINVSDIWIFNNVFRIETQIDPYPQYIRLYANPGNIASLNNIKILNNLFLDGGSGWPVIDFDAYGGNPTASGIEIKNNIFYNTTGVKITASSAFSTTSFSFGSNIYYPSSGTSVTFNGASRTPASWQIAMEPSAKLLAPQFISYSLRSPANNLRLASGDIVARNAGVSLMSYFAFDKDGVSRPQDSIWDIGPYEFSAGGLALKPPTNLRLLPN